VSPSTTRTTSAVPLVSAALEAPPKRDGPALPTQVASATTAAVDKGQSRRRVMRIAPSGAGAAGGAAPALDERAPAGVPALCARRGRRGRLAP
jgi:hypothetical protein